MSFMSSDSQTTLWQNEEEMETSMYLFIAFGLYMQRSCKYWGSIYSWAKTEKGKHRVFLQPKFACSSFFPPFSMDALVFNLFM